LASYKRPSRIVFVAEIPRLPSGKVLRRVLKERYGCASDH
jgi:long-chain acyl-CoA synthetase